MANCREIQGLGAGRLAAAVVALLALLAAAASYASQDSPFKLITAWQMGKLGGTEFSTHPIVKKGEQFFLLRHIKEGELFPGLTKKYCEDAGIADECKDVTARAEEFHTQEHWHKNWQPGDRVYLLVPDKIYKSGETAQK